VLGDITTVIPRRKKPLGSREAFQAGGGDDRVELVDIKVEDLASVLLRFENGAKGSFSVGQVCAGHKNDLILEICGPGGSIRWRQEHQNELWVGHRDKANEILQKDPSLMDADVRHYAHLPGGHQESWADAFTNIMRDIYGVIADGSRPGSAHPPAFATFEDGYRANAIVEAILQSAKQGSVWTKVSY
jgi:predicted dehydrogenase